jgi:glycosyltransferase involved in cell wall biosynthesis
MKPLISVIIPVYNRTWELRRALQSLKDQTYHELEVVICDDGSSEDIASIVAEFQNQLSIEFLRIENSGGPARPRNVAFKRARGDWISFLDSDDWWDSNRMATVVSAISDDVDVIYHSLRYIGKDGRAVRRGLSRSVGFPMRHEPLRHMALHGNPIPASAAVVRRSMLEKIGGMCEDPNLVAYEDFDAWLRLAEKGARFHYLSAILGSYWIGDDAISAMSEKQIHRQVTLFNRHLPYFVSFEIESKARQDYTLGLMWSRITNHSDTACVYLSRARNLPTMVMRINRIFKLTMLRFGL